MQRTLEKVNALWAAYKEMQPIAPEYGHRLEKKFRLEFNYNSNHMEGNTLTYGETALLLFWGNTKGEHNMREYEEMKAHDVAYQLIQQWTIDARPLTESDIKNLNKIILVKPFWKDAITPDGQDTRRLISIGDYKAYPNSVRLQNGEIFEYASPIDTPIQMGELVQWYNTHADAVSGHDEAHPLFLASLLHYRFVRIHPFDDGNGRVARLLMNYVLLKNGLPPVVIKSAEKANYLRALNAADTGDMDTFVKYIGEKLIWSLELAIKAAKGENLDEPDDLDKELMLLQQQLAEKTVLTTQATPEIVIDTFNQSIVPILQLLEEKLNTFKPYFFEIERMLEIQSLGELGTYNVGLKEHNLSSILNELNDNGSLIPSKRIENIKYNYYLLGFKNVTAAYDYRVTIEIQFGSYNFSIAESMGNSNLLKLPYRYNVSTEEMQEIITPPVKRIIEQIKNDTAKKP